MKKTSEEIPINQQYLIVTSDRESLSVFAIADSLRRIGHGVIVRDGVEVGEIPGSCDGVIFVECESGDVVVGIAAKAFSAGVVVAAVGGCADELAEVAGDAEFITACGANAAEEVVRTLRQLTETPIAQDAETLTEVLRDIEGAGYTESVRVGSNGVVTCLACKLSAAAESFGVDILRRLEGVSDPDDELVAVGTRCPNCGAHAAVVLGYGPNASMDDTFVLQSLQLSHTSRTSPRG